MTEQVTVGSVNVTLSIFIESSLSGDGEGLAGLVFNSTNLAAYYRRSDMAEPVAITLVTATATTHADGGFIRTDLISASPVAVLAGSYALHAPDAMWTSGQFCELTIAGADNMVPYRKVIRIAADESWNKSLAEPTGPLSPTATRDERLAYASHYTQNELVDDTVSGKTQVKNDAGSVIVEHTNNRTSTATTRGKGVAP